MRDLLDYYIDRAAAGAERRSNLDPLPEEEAGQKRGNSGETFPVENYFGAKSRKIGAANSFLHPSGKK
jgi:hypothetical protein